jgi:hypothetical protein
MCRSDGLRSLTLVDVGARDRLDRVGDRLGVAGVGGIDGEVHDQPVSVGLDDVDRGHRAGGLADSGRDPAHGEGVRPTVVHSPPLPAAGPSSPVAIAPGLAWGYWLRRSFR